MHVTNVRWIDDSESCELHADVHCDTHWVWGSDPFPLWYRFPRRYRALLDTECGDPFLAALLLPAMLLSESLEVEAAVSPKLLNAIAEIQMIYRFWHPELPLSPVRAPAGEVRRCPSDVGLFFSLGVDSCYSLLKNLRLRRNDSEEITSLIIVQGFDVHYCEQEQFRVLFTQAAQVAGRCGKDLVPAATNLRELTDRVADWRQYYGAALASVALALGPMCRSVTIAADQDYGQLLPRGSHPLLDPLWGTESLCIRHDGLEATRLQKLRFLSSSDVLLEHLHVCTSDEAGDEYNCGRCEKCVRTMVGLHIAGGLERCKTLPNRIDLELLRRLALEPASAETNAIHRKFLSEHRSALSSIEGEDELKAALDACLSSAAAP